MAPRLAAVIETISRIFQSLIGHCTAKVGVAVDLEEVLPTEPHVFDENKHSRAVVSAVSMIEINLLCFCFDAAGQKSLPVNSKDKS